MSSATERALLEATMASEITDLHINKAFYDSWKSNQKKKQNQLELYTQQVNTAEEIISGANQNCKVARALFSFIDDPTKVVKVCDGIFKDKELQQYLESSDDEFVSYIIQVLRIFIDTVVSPSAAIGLYTYVGIPMYHPVSVDEFFTSKNYGNYRDSYCARKSIYACSSSSCNCV